MSIASDIRAALKNAGEPQTAAQVRAVIGDHVPAARVASALSAMKGTGEVQCDEDARPRTYTLDPSFKPSRKRPGDDAEPPRERRAKGAGKPGRKPGAKGKAKRTGAPKRGATAEALSHLPKLQAETMKRMRPACATPGGDRTVSERALRLLTAAVLASELTITGSLGDALSEAQRAIAN